MATFRLACSTAAKEAVAHQVIADSFADFADRNVFHARQRGEVGERRAVDRISSSLQRRGEDAGLSQRVSGGMKGWAVKARQVEAAALADGGDDACVSSVL